MINRLKYMCRTLVAVMAGVLAFAGNAVAEGNQFYFTAMVAPMGSMSAPGSNAKAVFLRWDVVEGVLPADLKEVVLLRDGNELARVNPNLLMTVAEINGIYSGAFQERRRLEMERWLSESGPENGSIGEKVLSKLQTDSFWGAFASRVDFSIALARHRGFLDTTATAGNHTYELQAVSSGAPAVIRRIGQLTIDTTVFKTIPAAVNFKQVAQARCDAPDRAKDDGAVYLNWGMPGATAVERIANNLMTAGFDIYRTTANVEAIVGGAPTNNIRALAAAASHDANGNVVLAGLEKVNDQPVLVTPNQLATESAKLGWNPEMSQFQETASEVVARGLKPGDTRAYYLVPRDFTGNYGATIGAYITVPDLTPPVAPWHVHTTLNSAAAADVDKFMLEWPAVDARNYADDHQVNRQYCNLGTALSDGELAFVAADENCAATSPAVVKLDAVKYLVYRFDNIQTARNFSDSDGDGFSDIAERFVPDPLNHPDITRPTDTSLVGTPSYDPAKDACAPAGLTGPALVATVTSAAVVTRNDGRKVFQFKDATPVPPPGATESPVYWYRIASVDNRGNISSLSKPIRAFFPSRQFPARSGLAGTIQVGKASVCSYVTSLQDNFLLLYPYGRDLSGDAKTMQVSCSSASGATSAQVDFAIKPQLFGGMGARLAADACTQFRQVCGSPTALTTGYLDNSGTVMASYTFNSADLAYCPLMNHRTELSKTCAGGGTNLVTYSPPGEVVDPGEWPLINYTGSQCIKVYREIGGNSEHYETLCPPQDWPVKLDMASLGGEKVCISVAEMTNDGEVSAKVQIPCVVMAPDGPPAAPQLTGYTFSSATNASTLSWLPPEQPVAGTIIEWFWKGADSSVGQTMFSKFVGHAGHSRQDGSLQDVLALTPEQTGTGWQEEWCVRARSVGYAKSGNEEDALSAWSPQYCSVRLPATVAAPTYLPWPKIPTVKKLGDLHADFLPGLLTGTPVIRLSDSEIVFPPNTAITQVPVCSDTGQGCVPVLPQIGYTTSFCSILQNSVSGGLGFVAYRQGSSVAPIDAYGNPINEQQYGDYMQVSPLIDRMQCAVKNWLNLAGLQPYAEINDPFIYLLYLGGYDFTNWPGYRMAFVDWHPHVYKHWYRYQLVYFDSKGEITGYRQTNWVQEP